MASTSKNYRYVHNQKIGLSESEVNISDKSFLRQLLPILLLLLIPCLIIIKLIIIGPISFGDTGFVDVHHTHINYMYFWDVRQFGTNVRQGLNTVRDAVTLLISGNNYIDYFITSLLPILLIPINYYFVLKKMRIKNEAILVIASLMPLFNPILFGEYISGENFWIYIALIWVIYGVYKLYFKHFFTLKNCVFISLFLFLCMGMLSPIIVPLFASLFGLAILSFLLDKESVKLNKLSKYVISGIVICTVFFMLSLPYLFGGVVGQQAYKPNSVLGDYYNNYSATTFLNTLRLAGNNGDGQWQVGYNDFTITNIAGYLLLVGIIVGAIRFLQPKNMSFENKKFITACLILFLTLIGFLNLMYAAPAFGEKFFQSQWLATTIRNPSKIYNIILPIFVILFAFALESFIKEKQKSAKYATYTVFVLLIAIYGWPAFRGDLGLLHNSPKGNISSYKPETSLLDISNYIHNTSDRTLLIPATHRDELTYGNSIPGMNILALQGSLADTQLLTNNIIQTFNDEGTAFFALLNASSIKNIVVKNKFSAVEGSDSGLFASNLGSNETVKFLSTALKLENKNKNYYIFKNQNANNLIYSPTTITNIENDDNILNMTPFMNKNNAVVDRSSSGFINLTSNYHSQSSLANSQNIVSGSAILYNPQLVLTKLKSDLATGKILTVNELNPLTGKNQYSTTKTFNKMPQVVRIDGQFININKENPIITLRANYSAITGYSMHRLNINNSNPSFENPSNASDATPNSKDAAKIKASQNTDSTNGKYSINLASKNHTAYVEKIMNLDGNGRYFLTFDYKNIYGASASYSLKNDSTNYTYSQGKLPALNNWQTQNLSFKVSGNDTDQVSLYLYTTGKYQHLSSNLFDNLNLYKLENVGSSEIKMPPYLSFYSLSNYNNKLKTTDISDSNLIENGTFDTGQSWSSVMDSSPNDPGEPIIESKRTKDNSGNYALQLSSSAHTAFVDQVVKNFQPNAEYKISFDYKHITGHQPAYGIWQQGANLLSPSSKLNGTNNWNHFESTFTPDQNTNNLILYLYTESGGQKSVNLFDNVNIQKLPLISNYIRAKETAKFSPSLKINNFTIINPTKVNIETNAGQGLIVFNQSYNKGWHAYLKSENRLVPLNENSHVEVNGFSNGWWLTDKTIPNEVKSKNYTVVLKFTPQDQINREFIVSILTLIFVVLVLIWPTKIFIKGKFSIK